MTDDQRAWGIAASMVLGVLVSWSVPDRYQMLAGMVAMIILLSTLMIVDRGEGQ